MFVWMTQVHRDNGVGGGRFSVYIVGEMGIGLNQGKI